MKVGYAGTKDSEEKGLGELRALPRRGQSPSNYGKLLKFKMLIEEFYCI
jgi:hypothetical protein